MTLKELIVAVKEKNLTKEQLEAYADQMSSLFAEMQLEIAELEKLKALYFEGNQVGLMGETVSDISIKRKWSATKEGQREITLKRYCLATKELLNSLKSRVYRLIY